MTIVLEMSFCIEVGLLSPNIKPAFQLSDLKKNKTNKNADHNCDFRHFWCSGKGVGGCGAALPPPQTVHENRKQSRECRRTCGRWRFLMTVRFFRVSQKSTGMLTKGVGGGGLGWACHFSNE